MEESIEIIVARQLARGFSDRTEARERTVIARRYPLYKQHGDVQIFSHNSPDEIVNEIFQELNKLGLPK